MEGLEIGRRCRASRFSGRFEVHLICRDFGASSITTTALTTTLASEHDAK